jgi:branched-chain amino acid transport system ATP-binding protein
MALGLEWSRMDAGYSSMRVLFDVNIRVPKGSVLALLGPNGAGKTTSLRAAAGVIRPKSGKVFLDETDVTRWNTQRRTRRGLCLVPEGRGIFPSLSVEENLLLHTHLKGRGAQKEIEATAYARFPRLGERRRQIAGTLSGGEQQMLALSRSLTTDPKVLLLDEISMGLAPLVVQELFGVVRELASEGMTIVIVEQLVQDALQIADYVALLNKGRVMAIGQPADVADDIVSSYLGAHTDTHNTPVAATVARAAETAEFVYTPNGTLIHHHSCPIAQHQTVLRPAPPNTTQATCGMCNTNDTNPDTTTNEPPEPD